MTEPPNDPCFLKWMCSSEAVFISPTSKRSTATGSRHAASTPWNVPPHIATEHTLSSVLYDPCLPKNMLDQLSVLMRAEHDRFDDRVSLQEMMSHLVYTNRAISNVSFDPKKESTTTSVTVSALSLLKTVTGELGLGDIDNEREPRDDGWEAIGYIVDWSIKKGADVTICWEDKSQVVFDECIGPILQDAEEKKQYPVTVWDGKIGNSTHSILGKIAAVLSRNKACWSVLFGGKRFVVIFGYKKPGSRPALFISDPIDFDDGTTPLLALLIYMLMTTSEDTGHTTLASKLSIRIDDIPEEIEDHYTPPPGDSPTSAAPASHRYDTRGMGGNINQAAVITTSARDYQSPVFRFVRAVPTIAPRKGSCISHIRLHHRLYAGAVGYVMLGSTIDGELAIKFAQAHNRKALAIEAAVYEILACASDRPTIPVFYGLFEGPAWNALVMSFEGAMVEDFKKLPLRCRKQIMSTLKRVHALGIEHGDFAERNVVQGHLSCIVQLLRPLYTLIDFSHARTRHHCQGSGCRELQDAMKQLGLTSDVLSFRSRGSYVLQYFPIFKKPVMDTVATWIESPPGWQWRGQLIRHLGHSMRCLISSSGWWQLISKSILYSGTL